VTDRELHQECDEDRRDERRRGEHDAAADQRDPRASRGETGLGERACVQLVGWHATSVDQPCEQQLSAA
jgi:hypothetical protein